MIKQSLKTLCFLTLLMAISIYFQLPASATEAQNNVRVVDGIAIYIGIMPAALIRGHSNNSIEQAMHNGKPSSQKSVHLVVSLFNDKTGARIENAKISGSIMELGIKAQKKELEIMYIADTFSYGNFFTMPSNNFYHIKLLIRLRNGTEIKTQFTHKHFTN